MDNLNKKDYTGTNNADNNNGNNEIDSPNMPDLYDEEIAKILHDDKLFPHNDSITDISNDISNMNGNTTRPNNNNRNTSNISSTNNNSIIPPNTDNASRIETIKNRNNSSSAVSIGRESASSGTVEDIINPSFRDNLINNTSTSRNDERSLMLARDANINHLIRRGSPVNLYSETNNNFNNSNINKNNLNPLYSTNILRNSITESFQAHHNQLQSQNNNDDTINNLNKNTRNIKNPTTLTRRQPTHKPRPAFVNKLWSMINDDSNTNFIQWSEDGKSFIVVNRESFVHNILPKYFKHSNFASFVRQLNMYGWHKVQDAKSGSIQSSSDDKWQFSNENFQRGREDLLERIVRQKSSNNNQNNNIENNNSSFLSTNSNATGGYQINNNNNNYSKLQSTFSDDVNTVNLQLPGNLNPRATLHITNGPESIQTQTNVGTLLNELEQIKFNQIAISKDLLRINEDNEMLWKENMMARERHRSQQQVLEKIFRFLAAMMPHVDQKMIMDGILDNNNSNDNKNTTKNTGNNTTNSNSNRGPKITENIFDEIINKNNGNHNINNQNNSINNMNNILDNSLNMNTPITNHSNNANNSDLNNHNVYLETLEDLDNSPVSTINMNNLQGQNDSIPKTRLLLKNRSSPKLNDEINDSTNGNSISNGERNNRNNSGSTFTIPKIPSSTSTTSSSFVTNANNVNSDGIDNNNRNDRISEILFDEDEEHHDRTKNINDNNSKNNNLNIVNEEPIIQEVNSSKTSPHLEYEAQMGSTDTDNTTNNTNNDNSKLFNDNGQFSNLQKSIDEQQSRIHNLEELVNEFAPSLMSPDELSRKLNGSNTNNENDVSTNSNNENSINTTSNMNTDMNLNLNSDNAFNLQDYIGNESIESPSNLIGSGLTPLMIDEHDQLDNSLNISNDINNSKSTANTMASPTTSKNSSNVNNNNHMHEFSTLRTPQIEEITDLDSLESPPVTNKRKMSGPIGAPSEYKRTRI